MVQIQLYPPPPQKKQTKPTKQTNIKNKKKQTKKDASINIIQTHYLSPMQRKPRVTSGGGWGVGGGMHCSQRVCVCTAERGKGSNVLG